MFRIIVISLFVANVLLVGFQVSQPAKQTKAASIVIEPQDHSIPTIHLFSEIMQDQDLLSGSRQCFTMGPFHDIADMHTVRSRLQADSLSSNYRTTQALVEKGYWVFLRPYGTLLEANEVLFALQAFGLTDVAVIFDGEYRNSISLGYFLRQENALRRKTGLEEKGYEPMMRVQRTQEHRYWLDYEKTPGSSLFAMNMNERPNDFTQRAMPCPEYPSFEVQNSDSELQLESEQETTVNALADGDELESEKG